MALFFVSIGCGFPWLAVTHEEVVTVTLQLTQSFNSKLSEVTWSVTSSLSLPAEATAKCPTFFLFVAPAPYGQKKHMKSALTATIWQREPVPFSFSKGARESRQQIAYEVQLALINHGVGQEALFGSSSFQRRLDCQ